MSTTEPRTRTVLLVEDDRAYAEMIVAAARFDAPELRFRSCENLREALAVDADRIDLVVTDLGLPDAEGTEVLDALTHHFAGVPIVVLSGRLGRLTSAIETTTARPVRTIDKSVGPQSILAALGGATHRAA